MNASSIYDNHLAVILIESSKSHIKDLQKLSEKYRQDLFAFSTIYIDFYELKWSSEAFGPLKRFNLLQ